MRTTEGCEMFINLSMPKLSDCILNYRPLHNVMNVNEVQARQ